MIFFSEILLDEIAKKKKNFRLGKQFLFRLMKIRNNENNISIALMLKKKTENPKEMRMKKNSKLGIN